jgi:hypothetical protein
MSVKISISSLVNEFAEASIGSIVQYQFPGLVNGKYTARIVMKPSSRRRCHKIYFLYFEKINQENRFNH